MANKQASKSAPLTADLCENDCLARDNYFSIDQQIPWAKGEKGRKARRRSICMIAVRLTAITLTDTENMCLVLEKEQERRLLLLRTAAGAQIVQC